MTKKSSSQIQIEGLQKKIETAQDAVGKMTDDSLKPIAFQTILQRLLASDEGTGLKSEKTPQLLSPSKREAKRKDKQPKGAKGRVEELVREGFFAEPRTVAEVRSELQRHGWHHASRELSRALIRVVREKKLRRIKEPENEGGKLVWRYSNW